MAQPSRACGVFELRHIVPLTLATALNPLNSSMLATALVPISQAFPDQDQIGAWLVASLYLTAAIAQPVLGKFADRFGARRTLFWSIVVLGAGAILAAIARDAPTLIASRVLIGIGTSGGFPCAVSLVRHRAAAMGVETPTRILGVLAAISAAAVALGPPLGGFITEWFDWRAVFIVNLPLALVTLAFIIRLDPNETSAYADGQRIDWLGIGLFTVFMSALVLFLMRLAHGVEWISLAAAVVAFALLIAVSRRARGPFFDIKLLNSNRQLSLTYLNHLVFNFVNYCFFYSVPQWSQLWLDMPIAASGFVLMPVAISSGLASLAPTRGRIGAIIEITGAACLIGVSGLLFLLDDRTTLTGLMALTALFGVSYGVLNMSNQQRLLDFAPIQQSGAAAGMLRTAAYCGAILSAPLVGYVISGGLGDHPMSTLAFVMLPLSLVPALTVIADFRNGRHSF